MLEAKGLYKAYEKRVVLNNVSFCLPAGQCLGVAGENGSGKSTLLSILAQVQRPDRGDIRCGGRSILGDRKFLRTRLGYVPQDRSLLPGVTAAQQLKLWQSACGLSGPLPGDLGELLGLDETLLKTRTEALSGGMQRRVSIAMALLSRPEILIMDEATTGLDGNYAARLLDWLEAWLRQGGRMVWCSHHPAELERLCGSCLRLKSAEVDR